VAFSDLFMASKQPNASTFGDDAIDYGHISSTAMDTGSLFDAPSHVVPPPSRLFTTFMSRLLASGSASKE
jgi:hypothetical protein